MSKKTPLEEYKILKEENPNTIVLFQIGNFYEALFEDAKIVSEITGVVLTKRNFKGHGEVPSAGVPKHAINSYIKKLLANNYKICTCEEFKNENDDCFRKATRIYTQGTIIENEFLEQDTNNFILSIYFSKDTHYLAYADVSTGQFYKTQGNYAEIEAEIEKIEPSEIIISNNQVKLYEKIEEKYPTTILDDNLFDDCTPEDAILKYCKKTQKEYCCELNKIVKYDMCNFLKMDNNTRRNLEITRTKKQMKKKGSLLWFLNHTKTPMGARLLKKFLNEPLLNTKKIIERQSAVEELLNNSKILTNLISTLENFNDLSRICAHISNSTISPKELYQLAKNSNLFTELSQICDNFNSELLKADKETLSKVSEVTSEIKDALYAPNEDEFNNARIINEGYETELDFLYLKLKKIESKIKQYEKEEQKRLNIENLKISTSATLGYYIELSKSKMLKAGNDYIKKQTLSSCTRYTTEKLKALEEEIFALKHRIFEFEKEIYNKLKKKVANFITDIRKLAISIAQIDVFVSYAQSALENNLSKPTFNDEGIFIKNGYHPSLLKLNNDLTKNDTYLKNGNMAILTGANMSGKSTYLKHNAIICIMSQIGCYVPADSANLTIVDKIFVRQDSNDDIINNNSSFMVEMLDFKYILDNITDNSLILFDEPAKSTNEKEGGAIARSFFEYILENYKTKTIIVTHNLQLTKIKDLYPNSTINLVIGSKNEENKTINDRKIRQGVVSTSLAINTAKLACLPSVILDKAKQYANT